MALVLFIVCWVAAGVVAWKLYKTEEAPLTIHGHWVELIEARAVGVMVDGQLAGTLIELPDDRTWTFLQRPGLSCDATQFEQMEQALDYGVRQYLKSQAAVEYVSQFIKNHRDELLRDLEPLPPDASRPDP